MYISSLCSLDMRCGCEGKVLLSPLLWLLLLLLLYAECKPVMCGVNGLVSGGAGICNGVGTTSSEPAGLEWKREGVLVVNLATFSATPAAVLLVIRVRVRVRVRVTVMNVEGS